LAETPIWKVKQEAAEDFIHVQYFLRDRFGVADQQRAGGSAQGVKLRPSRRGQPRSLPIFVNVCAYPGKKSSAASCVVSPRKPIA
jgi:hypothetical protein